MFYYHPLISPIYQWSPIYRYPNYYSQNRSLQGWEYNYVYLWFKDGSEYLAFITEYGPQFIVVNRWHGDIKNWEEGVYVGFNEISDFQCFNY